MLQAKSKQSALLLSAITVLSFAATSAVLNLLLPYWLSGGIRAVVANPESLSQPGSLLVLLLFLVIILGLMQRWAPSGCTVSSVRRILESTPNCAGHCLAFCLRSFSSCRTGCCLPVGDCSEDFYSLPGFSRLIFWRAGWYHYGGIAFDPMPAAN